MTRSSPHKPSTSTNRAASGRTSAHAHATDLLLLEELHAGLPVGLLVNDADTLEILHANPPLPGLRRSRPAARPADRIAQRRTPAAPPSQMNWRHSSKKWPRPEGRVTYPSSVTTPQGEEPNWWSATLHRIDTDRWGPVVVTLAVDLTDQVRARHLLEERERRHAGPAADDRRRSRPQPRLLPPAGCRCPRPRPTGRRSHAPTARRRRQAPPRRRQRPSPRRDPTPRPRSDPHTTARDDDRSEPASAPRIARPPLGRGALARGPGQTDRDSDDRCAQQAASARGRPHAARRRISAARQRPGERSSGAPSSFEAVLSRWPAQTRTQARSGKLPAPISAHASSRSSASTAKDSEQTKSPNYSSSPRTQSGHTSGTLAATLASAREPRHSTFSRLPTPIRSSNGNQPRRLPRIDDCRRTVVPPRRVRNPTPRCRRARTGGQASSAS